MAVQVPVFGGLSYLYSRRPVADPGAVNYDIRLYYDAATAVLSGQLPYRDFFFQYPPLALLAFVPPRWFASDLASYFTWFNLELLVLACIGVLATGALARLVGLPAIPTFPLYALGLLALGALVPQRYDLVPAVFVLLSLAGLLAGKSKTAFVLLAIGTMMKIYPALLVPVFAIWEWRTRGAGRAARGLVIFAALVLLFILPFLLIAPRETVNAFGDQAGRGVGIASVYASLMLAARPFGFPAAIVYQQALNSWNVQLGDAQWPAFAAGIIQLMAVLLVYIRFYKSGDLSNSILVRYSAAAIGIGILTSKVLSAQYIIWLFPIPFLVGGKRFLPVSVLFLACSLLTQLLYPFLWGDMKLGTATALGIALARDACLAALCLLLMVASPSAFRTSRAEFVPGALGKRT